MTSTERTGTERTGTERTGTERTGPGAARRRGRSRWVSVAAFLTLLAGTGTALPGADIPVGLSASGTASGAGVAATSVTSASAGLPFNPITSSAMTLSGTGEFADLRVTLGQTKDLANQAVSVTWKWGGANPGSHATVDLGGSSKIQANFLQLMQCWGDTAPDRTQCVFGAYHTGEENPQTFANGRQILTAGHPQANVSGYPGAGDPLETVDPTDPGRWGNWAENPQSNFVVPFVSAAGETSTYKQMNSADQNPFFSVYDSNEIPFARTRADGTGDEVFETLTYQESAGLGCGQIRTSGTLKGKVRNCWLVVVPRGATDANGKSYDQDPMSPRLASSALSLTNWQHRIVFPLNFQPVGVPCPIGAHQRPTGGVESSTQAVLRWQPALCRNNGPVFSYLKLPDAVAESGPTGTSVAASGLTFLNAPISPSDVPTDRTLVYAPIAVSGIGIAVMYERYSAAAADKPRNGQRVSDVKLTPRLVAKLLTGSYRSGIDSGAHYLGTSPSGPANDPDFLALNPDFRGVQNGDLELLVPTGVSYTTSLLWQYVAADPDARDFVAGRPDPWGMRVNPFYQGLTIPNDTFPKVDPYCIRSITSGVPPLCQMDLHPYMQDFYEDARYTSKGDTRALMYKSQEDTKTGFTKRKPPSDPGVRSLMGVTDSATAARFLLPMVKLRNASGQFVAPTTASMTAALATMQPSAVPGVKLASPESARGSAYPLTTVTYAVTAPNQLQAAAAKDYATFVRYAVGAGQTLGTSPGTLPYGYDPLPTSLRREALTAATRIQNRVGPAASRPAGGGASTGGASGPAPSAAAPSPAPSATTPVPAPTATLASPQLRAQRTPADTPVAAFLRYALVAALLVGSAGVVLGPLLPRVASTLRARRVRR